MRGGGAEGVLGVRGRGYGVDLRVGVVLDHVWEESLLVLGLLVCVFEVVYLDAIGYVRSFWYLLQ